MQQGQLLSLSLSQSLISFNLPDRTLIVRLDQRANNDRHSDGSDGTISNYSSTTAGMKVLAIGYRFRGLIHDQEILKWTTFCEATFAYKQPNPPTQAYFTRHYVNDPNHDVSHVRIATTKTSTTTTDMSTGRMDAPTSPHNMLHDDDTNYEEIVSSCRIFIRHISFPQQHHHNSNIDTKIQAKTTSAAMAPVPVDDSPKTIRTTQQIILAAGIGEVCTMESHRYRGLAKELLHDAIACVKEYNNDNNNNNNNNNDGDIARTSKFTVSFLHSSPTFFPVYQKVGYRNITSHWSAITIDQSKLLTLSRTQYQYSTTGSIVIRRVSFPNDIEQLMLLHQYYSEQRFIGCIIRSYDYWNQYVHSECLHDSMYVMEEISTDISKPTNKILAWMSLRYRQQQERFQLREFGCYDIDEVPYLFPQLLIYCHEKQKDKITENLITNANINQWKLHLPTPILRDVQQELVVPNDDNETNVVPVVSRNHDVHHKDKGSDDENSNYFSNCVSENDHGWMYKPILIDEMGDDSWINNLTTSTARREHLIWPSDSF